MPTTTSEFPKELKDYFMCKLLHERKPVWNGEYKEFQGKMIPDTRWVCEICDKEKLKDGNV